MNKTEKSRLAARAAFFLLFIVAPPLDLFRYDLNLGHFYFLGFPWTLGLEALQRGEITALEASLNIFTRGFIPLAIVVVGGGWVAWKWGRLYCGWLCPHFSVVEIINAVLRRASGKPSVWEKTTLPDTQLDGTHIQRDKTYWIWFVVTAFIFSLVWSVVLLTYLLPPVEIYSNLFSAELTRNQAVFIGVATLLFTIEFTLARHMFCRYGCAIGLAQSLVWMGNKKAMVVGFDRSRSSSCASCDKSCEHVCPMRLKPRNIKRKMFTCTQCLQCVQACERVQEGNHQTSLLQTLSDQCAFDVSVRDFGKKPDIPGDCFKISMMDLDKFKQNKNSAN